MPKLLFLVSEDWYFCSHRLSLARAAQRSGYSIIIATRVQDHGKAITAEGFKLRPISMVRRGRNPFNELSALIELIKIYRSEKPDIVHHVALKPVVYGSVAAWIAGIPRIINAIAGMGFVFSSNSVKAKLLRPFVKLILEFLLNRKNTRTIFQNPDDRNMLIKRGVVRAELTTLIRGSGVDPNRYAPSREPAGIVTVVLASRMLWDKGIKEFVEAARFLKSQCINARFVLVGDTDSGNFASVPEGQLEAWNKIGIVEWWGRRDDIPQIFNTSHIVCLPSAYGEGIPKVLIEAASCGLPIVTTDSPGCREIVRDNVNGFLVPVRDHIALAKALETLIINSELRIEMGGRGRALVLREFTEDKVVGETLALYETMMS